MSVGLTLYRTFLRAIPRSYPASPDVRRYVLQRVQAQFRQHRHETDPQALAKALQHAEQHLELILLGTVPSTKRAPRFIRAPTTNHTTSPTLGLLREAPTATVAAQRVQAPLQPSPPQQHPKKSTPLVAVTKQSPRLTKPQHPQHQLSGPSESLCAPRAIVVTAKPHLDTEEDYTTVPLNSSSFLPAGQNERAPKVGAPRAAGSASPTEPLNAPYLVNLTQSVPQNTREPAPPRYEVEPAARDWRPRQPVHLNAKSFVPAEQDAFGLSGRVVVAIRPAVASSDVALNPAYVSRLAQCNPSGIASRQERPSSASPNGGVTPQITRSHR